MLVSIQVIKKYLGLLERLHNVFICISENTISEWKTHYKWVIFQILIIQFHSYTENNISKKNTVSK